MFIGPIRWLMIIKTAREKRSFIYPNYPKNGALLPYLFAHELNIN